MKSIFWGTLLSLAGFPGLLSGQEQQQTARIGDFKLESGEVTRDCAIGFRTFGTLNSDKSNAVLFPTAFGCRTVDLATRIGAGKLVDRARYYVIAIDSLGDGISSSPSNSKSQPGLSFPQFSIRDLVSVEQKVVSESMHIRHLHAVIGFSMGGMQAFQWAVSYPEFADKIVAIVGSPQLSSYDLLLWRTVLLSLESDPDWKQGQYSREPALHLMNMVQALTLQTPEFVATNTARQDYPKFESELSQGPDDLHANDTVRQIQAPAINRCCGLFWWLPATRCRCRARTVTRHREQARSRCKPSPGVRVCQSASRTIDRAGQQLRTSRASLRDAANWPGSRCVPGEMKNPANRRSGIHPEKFKIFANHAAVYCETTWKDWHMRKLGLSLTLAISMGAGTSAFSRSAAPPVDPAWKAPEVVEFIELKKGDKVADIVAGRLTAALAQGRRAVRNSVRG